MATTDDNDKSAFSLSSSSLGNGDDVPVLVSVRTSMPEVRTPLDLCCVIDVSGSMTADAEVHSSSGTVERDGLSILDIVKHAVRTVSSCLTPDDRISIVSFSSDSKIDLPLTALNDAGRKRSDKVLEGLRPDGGTNLWAGIEKGLDVFGEGGRGEKHAGHRMSACWVFTDGQPNEGKPSLESLVERKDKGSLPCAISTFGFGYNLTSKLLLDLAREGGGSYGFIPDSGLVGTTFVHAVSNALVTCARSPVLSLEPVNGAKLLKVVGEHRTTMTSWGAQVDLTSLQLGQDKDIVVRMSVPQSAETFLSVTLSCVPVGAFFKGRKESEPLKVSIETANRGGSAPETTYHLRRMTTTSVITTALAERGDKARAAVAALCRDTEADVAENGVAQGEARLKGLLEDVQGQVTEAFSRDDWLFKWGVHYLPSICGAHLLQQCNNFKDPGVQFYGGKLFSTLRDAGDEAFLKLPAPKPSNVASHSSSAGGNPCFAPSRAAPVNMNAYYSSSNPCFSGNSSVAMADNSSKACQDVMPGDVTSCGKVVCVVKTRCLGGVADLVKLGELDVTPWHPVSIDGGLSWAFPADLGVVESALCDSVYSFVMEPGCSSVVVGGVHCATLGHGVKKGDAREHPFWGSSAVLDSLSRLPGWISGYVDLPYPPILRRDAKTNLVCDLLFPPVDHHPCTA